MNKIVHLVARDKFTDGYIIFMKKYMIDFQHIFFIHKEGFSIKTSDVEGVILVSSYKDLNNREYFHYLTEANLIIVSGFFYPTQMKAFLKSRILKKTYLHLWGGDFHCLERTSSIKDFLTNTIRRYFIKNAGGIINLLDDDYLELCKLCRPKGKHFSAPVCENEHIYQLIQNYREDAKASPITILVGNSATESNQHVQVFKMLKRYINESFEVLCPLSYGDDSYRKEIIKVGLELFGDRFHPLTDYMDLESYYKMLAKCSVAIMNNNRQQAMGTINALIALKCKVYIRKDTPMWKLYYVENQMNIYSAEDIIHLSFEDLTSFPEKEQTENYEKYLFHIDSSRSIIKWRIVFDSTGTD